MIGALVLTLTLIDRLARADAEQRLDRLAAQYAAAVATANASEIAAVRRQLDNAKIAVRVIQERERLVEESLAADPAAQQQRLELQKDREADLAQQTSHRF